MQDIISLTEDTDPSLDVVDPITTLTKRQRLAVQKTWDELCKGGRPAVGIAIFYLYFEQHPPYIQLFKQLRDVPMEQMKAHPRLKSHGTTVAQGFAGIIENLDDGEVAALVLQKIGRDHVKRNINQRNFADLKVTMMILFERMLGPMFTPLVKDSWDKALTVVMDVIMSAMEEEEKRLQSVKDHA